MHVTGAIFGVNRPTIAAHSAADCATVAAHERAASRRVTWHGARLSIFQLVVE